MQQGFAWIADNKIEKDGKANEKRIKNYDYRL